MEVQLPVSALPAWKKRLPMALTMSRLAVCPILVVLLSLKGNTYSAIAAGLFILASITDWFDGYFARKYDVITNMGKFMDPIADKILVATVLIMLIPMNRVGPILVLILLARDILIGGVRSVAAADQVVIDAKQAGKWKTGLQMVGIPAILVHRPIFTIPLNELGLLCLWVSVILSLISGAQYVYVYLEAKRHQLNG